MFIVKAIKEGQLLVPMAGIIIRIDINPHARRACRDLSDHLIG
jgi:hypothetical protein